MIVDLGRQISAELASAASREWLSTNGIGGFASGTVAGLLTRRYHGLLIAALMPPLGRTLLVSKLEERVDYDGLTLALGSNLWADGSVAPNGHHQIERFHLEGTTPVWTYACADARLEKRVWMEQGANTTYVQYRLARARRSLALELAVLVNYRDYHATTQGGWPMVVEPVEHGLRVVAFTGARPMLLLAPGAKVSSAHEWYYGFRLAREAERGLPAVEDHLRIGNVRATIEPGQSLTLILSAESSPGLDAAAAWRRRQRHEADLIARWRRTDGSAHRAPGWIQQLVLAADQFIVSRTLADEPDGRTVIAGYHWFGDWGRDTMISLPGLSLATGRQEVARRILTTFARFVDRGMLPNRFPDAGEAPEYNTVDATLWYFDAIRAYHEATGDDGLVKDLFNVLESIVDFHRRGTRYGIVEDEADGLLRAGEPGVQLTWMDAKFGEWVVTPRIGKPVEINALWFNALGTMARFAVRLGRPSGVWQALADRVGASFQRFWNAGAGYCYDVLDGPEGDEATLRPNQLFAVSLPESPLPEARQRQVVDACARHLLTAYGLRSLGPSEAGYRGRYAGGPLERDGAYHQGTVWSWLLGPFALAHLRVYRDPALAATYLEPLAAHLSGYGLGSIAEVFDGDPPHAPGGCIAQAWSVAETLRAWRIIAAAASASPSPARRRRV